MNSKGYYKKGLGLTPEQEYYIRQYAKEMGIDDFFGEKKSDDDIYDDDALNDNERGGPEDTSEIWKDETDGDSIEALGKCMFTKSEQEEVGGKWDRLVALRDVGKRSLDFQNRHLVFRIAWAFCRNKIGGVIIINQRQTKYQAIEFYDIFKCKEDGLQHEPRYEVQYANSPIKQDADLFLRGETIEYMECSDEAARAFEKHIMSTLRGNGLNDIVSRLVLFQGFLEPIHHSKTDVPDDGNVKINEDRKEFLTENYSNADDQRLVVSYNPLQDQTTFGVEFELSCGIGSQPLTVGWSLVKHSGVRAKLRYKKWSKSGYNYVPLGKRLYGDEWMFVEDRSIRGNPEWAHSSNFELVSPILQDENGLETCRQVFTTALDTCAIHVNGSMGLHVHIGIVEKEKNKDSLLVLQHISWNFCRFECIMDTFFDKSRVGNRFCKSNREAFVDAECDDDETIERIIFECGTRDSLFRLVNPSGRYHKLNLINLKTGRQPTIEFRQHNATDQFEDIEAWTRFCIAFIQKSIEKAGVAADINSAASGTTSTRPPTSKFEELFLLIGDESLKHHFHQRYRRAK